MLEVVSYVYNRTSYNSGAVPENDPGYFFIVNFYHSVKV